AIDGSQLRAPDGNYNNTIDHNDPILSPGMVSGIAPDASAGFFFSSSKFNLGLSADHIVPAAIKLTGTSSNLNLDLTPQYYFQTSYLASFSKNFALRPSIEAKSNGSNLQAEGDLVCSIKKFIWFGAGYRGFSQYTQDALVGLAGININENLLVSYSYDFTMSSLQSASQGSHEVIINYRVNLVKPAKPGKAIFNPRF
ncbi:MAG: PorP/SprF family type IX secretion system membrane protein, partial [Chitinophagales bacterium]